MQCHILHTCEIVLVCVHAVCLLYTTQFIAVRIGAVRCASLGLWLLLLLFSWCFWYKCFWFFYGWAGVFISCNWPMYHKHAARFNRIRFNTYSWTFTTIAFNRSSQTQQEYTKNHFRGTVSSGILGRCDDFYHVFEWNFSRNSFQTLWSERSWILIKKTSKTPRCQAITRKLTSKKKSTSRKILRVHCICTCESQTRTREKRIISKEKRH